MDGLQGVSPAGRQPGIGAAWPWLEQRSLTVSPLIWKPFVPSNAERFRVAPKPEARPNTP